MTQDELIKNITWLAQEAGLQAAYPIDHPMSKFIMAIEARATEKEREACALIVEENANKCGVDTVAWMLLASNAEAIRARGKE